MNEPYVRATLLEDTTPIDRTHRLHQARRELGGIRSAFSVGDTEATELESRGASRTLGDRHPRLDQAAFLRAQRVQT